MIVVGQGVDRLMTGEMSLYELQTLIVGQNEINKAMSPDAEKPEYDGPELTAEDWEQIDLDTARTLKAVGAE